MSKPVATPRAAQHRDGAVAALLRLSFRFRYGSVVMRSLRSYRPVTLAVALSLLSTQPVLAAGNLTLPFAIPNPRVTSWTDHHYPTREEDGLMVRFDGASGYAYDGHRGTDYAVPSNTPVVAADEGFAKKARKLADRLNSPLAIVEKRRHGNNSTAEAMGIIGSVQGKHALIVDDEIDTAGSLTQAVRVVHQQGALDVYCCATHGIFSGPAIDRLKSSPIKEIVITDSIPLADQKHLPNMTILSVAELFAGGLEVAFERRVRAEYHVDRAGEDERGFAIDVGERRIRGQPQPDVAAAIAQMA